MTGESVVVTGGSGKAGRVGIAELIERLQTPWTCVTQWDFSRSRASFVCLSLVSPLPETD